MKSLSLFLNIALIPMALAQQPPQSRPKNPPFWKGVL